MNPAGRRPIPTRSPSSPAESHRSGDPPDNRLGASILRSAAFVMLTNLLTMLTTMALAVVVARKWGAAGFGAYTFISSVALLLLPVANLGADMMIIVTASREPGEAGRYLGGGLMLTAVFALPTFALMMGVLWLTHAPGVSLWLAVAAGLFAVFGAMVLIFRAIFHSRMRMEFETIGLAVERALWLMGAVTAVLLGGGLTLLLAALAVARLANLAVSARLARSQLGIVPQLRVPIGWVLGLARQALPYGLNLVLAGAYTQLDIVILQTMRGASEVGLYRAASALITPLPIIALAVNAALLPPMSRLASSGRAQAAPLCRRSFRYMLFISLLLAALLLPLGRSVVLLLFGAQYLASVAALQIAAWSLPLHFIKYSLAYTLTSIGDQVYRTAAIAVGTAACIGSNLALIPRLGIRGAATSMLITEVVIVALLWASTALRIPGLRLWPMVPKPVLAAGAAGLVARLLAGAWLPVPIAAGVMVFVAVLAALRGLEPGDLSIMRRIASGLLGSKSQASSGGRSGPALPRRPDGK